MGTVMNTKNNRGEYYGKESDAEYTVMIANARLNRHSFLVALVPALSIPSEFPLNEDILISDLAIIAANKGTNTDKWAYAHLEKDEKPVIGDAMVEACCKLNKWYWCNLYKE